MRRIGLAFALFTAVSAGACDDDPALDFPPSPRFSVTGTVTLIEQVEDKKISREFARIDREIVATSESFHVSDETFEIEFALAAPDGSAAKLTVDGDKARFTPDLAGDYEISLIATDETGQSQARSFSFTARDNKAPNAVAAAPTETILKTEAQLDASGSKDADDGFALDDKLTFEWTLKGPDGKDATELLSSKTAEKPLFTPTQLGVYKATLVVSDQFDVSESVEVPTTVRTNADPIADVTRAVAGTLNQRVTLDGTGSVDPDGDDIEFTWTLFDPEGKDVTDQLADETTLTPSFVPIVEGTYRAELVVTDGFGTGRDQVLIDVAKADDTGDDDTDDDQTGDDQTGDDQTGDDQTGDDQTGDDTGDDDTGDDTGGDDTGDDEGTPSP